MFQILGMLSMLSCGAEIEKINEKSTLNVQLVGNYSNRGMRKSYKSSVKVSVFYQKENIGNGSGNYFTHRGKEFVITSAHIVSGMDRVIIEERFGLTTIECKVAYMDENNDIAILFPQEKLKSLKPIKYTWNDDVGRGEPVYYTGYPSGLEEISFRGIVSGSTAEFYIIQSAAWMGSSGSVVFNNKGQTIGIVSGVKVGFSPLGSPQVINNIVMVSPIFFLQESLLRNILNSEA